MCGIAGIIYRGGDGGHRVGRDMTRMLQSMKHRGPDSTGYALYRAPTHDLVLRVKLGEAIDPHDPDALPRRAAARSRPALRAAGRPDPRDRADQRRTRSAPRSPSRATSSGSPTASSRCRRSRCSRSATRSRSSRTSATRRGRGLLPPRRLLRQPRHRPRADGDRVRRRHLQRAPLLGVPVLRRRRRAQRPAHQLPPVAPAARARGPPLRLGLRLGDHRRLPRRADGAGRLARGRDAPQPRGARRRLHLHLRDRGRARHGQGRARRQAAGPLRVRRAWSRSPPRRSRSAPSSTTRSTPTTPTRAR